MKSNLLKKVLTTGIAAAMVMAMTVPAFAATPTVSSSATIEKDLAIAKQGVATPSATYTFTFAAVTTGAPSISAKTVSSSSTNTNTNGTVTLNTDALLSSTDISALTAAGPGVYEYNLTESANFTNTDDKKMTVDSTIYRIRIQVGYDNNALAVTAITAQKVATANATSSEEDSDKLSSITFNNTYTEYGNDNGDGSDSSKGLTISKTIGTTGAEDSSAKFVYKIEFTADSVNSGLTSSVSGTTLYTDEACTTEATSVSDSGTYYFKLGNGDSVNFKLPAGTGYTVTETNGDYTVATSTVTNGATAVSGSEAAVTSYVGQNANSVAYTNTKSANPLTGIINNYGGLLALVVIAAAGLVLVMVRRRRMA